MGRNSAAIATNIEKNAQRVELRGELAIPFLPRICIASRAQHPSQLPSSSDRIGDEVFSGIVELIYGSVAKRALHHRLLVDSDFTVAAVIETHR